MEAHEYATMAAFETDYWWYRALHRALVNTLHDFGVPAQARMLDAGCGTGGNLLSVGRHFADALGFDYSTDAAPFWRQRGLRRCWIGSVNTMALPDHAFDVVMSIDVLEVESVDEQRALSEIVRVAKPGGLVLLVVPAYRWLSSPEHDSAVHAARRYTRAGLLRSLRGHPLEVLRVTHLFTTLFPAIAGRRLLAQVVRPPEGSTPHSDLKPLPGPVNALLGALMRPELRLVRRVDLPFGSSILLVGRKRSA